MKEVGQLVGDAHRPLQKREGLGKSMVVFRLFEKLRYSNERSTIFRVFTTNRSIWRRKMAK